MLNAENGYENSRSIQPAAQKKKVAVLGGGPAGLEAARVAALRGHDVTLFEMQILATSDTHGKFDPWDYAANKADASGSVAQQATAIKENRTKTRLQVSCSAN